MAWEEGEAGSQELDEFRLRKANPKMHGGMVLHVRSVMPYSVGSATGQTRGSGCA